MYFSSNTMRAAQQPNRVVFYLVTMLWEWCLMAYVLFGARRHGTPLREVLGRKWSGAKDVFRDLGIALAFWIVALIVLGIVAHLLHLQQMGQNVRFLGPEGRLQIALWVMVSLTAGICEETIFRGYLQKQFICWFGNAFAGIVLSAAIFGAAHIYQGPKATVVIGVYGLMFGILAWKRGTVRPGMITHALHDTFSGLAVKLLPK